MPYPRIIKGREAELMLLREQGYSYPAIAKMFGVCESSVREILGKTGTVFDNPERAKRRFWSKVSIKTDGECWEWTGSFGTAGYGHIYWNKKVTDAHKVSYLINVGEIPDGLYVLHNCNNKRCVNPAHLRLGTPHDNLIDRYDVEGRLTEAELKERQRAYNQRYYYQHQEQMIAYARDRRRKLYAAGHPEILQFRSVGEASISIRECKAQSGTSSAHHLGRRGT